MNKKGSGWVVLGALLAGVGFFLPWIAVDGDTANGFTLPRSPVGEALFHVHWSDDLTPSDTEAETPASSETPAPESPDEADPTPEPPVETDPAPSSSAPPLDDPTLKQIGEAAEKIGNAVEKVGVVVGKIADTAQAVRHDVQERVADAEQLLDADPRRAVDLPDWCAIVLRWMRAYAYLFYLAFLLALLAGWRALSNRRSAAFFAPFAGLLLLAAVAAGLYIAGFTPWGAPALVPGLENVPDNLLAAFGRHAEKGMAVFLAGGLFLLFGGLRLGAAWRNVGKK